MEQADTIRTEIAVAYRTRAWQTVEVDLGPASPTEVDLVQPQVTGVAELGLAVPSPVRCLNLAEQIAQKLHACTGPTSAGRVRDILDILLIDMLGQLDYRGVAQAAQRVFAKRAAHPFPPSVSINAEWKPELEVLARDLGFPHTHADEIENQFRDFISKLSVLHADLEP